MAAVEWLGPDGALASVLAGYEPRQGQLAMADAVERTLATDRVLLCEAGTGTGKTLAYLVPALESGRKVVVSTATRALQDQIFTKDLPLIERALGRPVQVALMKGLANYICRRRYAEFRASEASLRPENARALRAIEQFVEDTESGDVGTLGALDEDDPVLGHVTSSSDTRLGASCRFHSECFVTRMKRDAEAAQLVVVNHHLFFADLALRGPHPGRVLPDYDAVIFDEAHQLEDVATTFFGVRVSGARIARLVADVERALERLGQGGALFGSSVARDARTAADSFFARLSAESRATEGRVTLERDFWTGPRQELWHRLDDALDGLRALAESVRGQLALPRDAALVPNRREAVGVADALELAGRRAEELRADLATITEGAKGRVTFFDATGRSPALSSAPVDVADLFKARLFETIPSIVLTSATLSSGRDQESGPKAFAFIRSRLGLEEDPHRVEELLVPSPFDYETNSILYLPKDLPAPNDPAFLEMAAERAGELIDITGGGAFVLTTSLRSMRELHRRLKARANGRRVLVQGEAPKNSLLGIFRAASDAVLVATTSFWQGVDVPGDALRLVVLEKIPFPVPSEPVIAARASALEAEGKNPFSALHLPMAKMALKQGFGRLIRTRDDRGVVALFDDRVHRRGYGKEILAALPPAKRTHDLEEVRTFFGASATLQAKS